MITDNQTNFVYLSGLLPERYPGFARKLTDSLRASGIEYGFLGHTKDVWCVDYMPIQVAKDRFVQFQYEPDYLKTKKYSHLRTDPALVCHSREIFPIKSDLIVDGGNIVKSESTAIMTDKIFSENQTVSKEEATAELRRLLDVERLIFVPQEPSDFIGHADGMVRFVDENTVIVNCYPETDRYKLFPTSK